MANYRASDVLPGVLCDVAGNIATASVTEVSIRNYASGQVFVPALSAITTITYYVCSKSGGTFLPAYDSSGSAVTQTVAAGRAYPIPAALFGAAYVKFITDAAGTVDCNFKS